MKNLLKTSPPPPTTQVRHSRCGFSLLEVIIATGILATSTVLLLSLFSTGERHASRAEQRVLAHMLCQSTLDELIANPWQLQSIENAPIEGYPNLTRTVDWAPMGIDGLVCVRVSIQRAKELLETREVSPTPRPLFELVRWMHHRPNSDMNMVASQPDRITPVISP